MVYMSGSKAARNAASLVNRPTCGGMKKAGLGPSVGWFMSSMPFLLRVAHNVPQSSYCMGSPSWPISRTIQTQQYGYRATIGGNMG